MYMSQFERISLAIDIWLLSEPEFTRTEIGWLLKDQINYMDIDKNLLEDNFIYYSNLFRKNARLSTNEMQLKALLLPALKKQFINIAKATLPQWTTEAYLNNLPAMDKEYYDYLKDRDPNWDLGKELRMLFG